MPRADLVNTRPCPAGYWVYKEKCLYVGSEMLEYKDAQEKCASYGAIIMPIQDRATYQFVQSLARLKKYQNIYIGMNFSKNLDSPLYSDRTVFNRSLHFQFDSDATKFGTKECVYLKKGVSYKPRSAHCNQTMQYICQWRSKNWENKNRIIFLQFIFSESSCPDNFISYPTEADGRTCYGTSSLLSQTSGPASDIKKKCKSVSNHLIRPGLPSSVELLSVLEQR